MVESAGELLAAGRYWQARGVAEGSADHARLAATLLAGSRQSERDAWALAELEQKSKPAAPRWTPFDPPTPPAPAVSTPTPELPAPSEREQRTTEPTPITEPEAEPEPEPEPPAPTTPERPRFRFASLHKDTSKP
jgi:hypothetical protein